MIDGADYVEPADLVIKALGFEPEDLPQLWGVEGLEVTRWGTVRADFETGQTQLPGVYAVGEYCTRCLARSLGHSRRPRLRRRDFSTV